MSIKLGNTNINKVYLGNTEIKKAYLGNTLILDNAVVTSSNLYTYSNAVSDDDIDSNLNWNATSAYFTESITSTDAGQNFSIGIEGRITDSNDTQKVEHTLPDLVIGTEYKATIRYKSTFTIAPAANPFIAWANVSGVTYPSIFSTGDWVEVDVIFTTTGVNPIMKIYPNWGSGGRTIGDILEISSITIIENI